MKTYYVIEHVVRGITMRVSGLFGIDKYPTIAGAVAFARSYANARKRLGMSIGVITVKQVELWK